MQKVTIESIDTIQAEIKIAVGGTYYIITLNRKFLGTIRRQDSDKPVISDDIDEVKTCVPIFNKALEQAVNILYETNKDLEKR